ncbi:MAG: 1-acyl-sn-glycerol-3-phosphate acyltransferase [Bacteriovoracaceae bacterium]
MNKIIDTVLTYPKLKERLQSRPEDKTKVLKCFEEIKGDYSATMVKTMSTLIDGSFRHLYDGINFEVPKGMDLIKLTKDNNVILVPNHQSHADYVAMTYLLFREYSLPVYVAGGINLNIFPIGKVFRKCGCFFIRRKFNSDILYKLTFEAYVYALLAEGNVIEFFFEGGRSRTGKLLPPRFGLFQMLIEAHALLPEDKKKPLMFMPVSLAHEAVPEQKSHAKELRGAKKEAEHSTQLFKLFKLFNKRLGTIHVRVNEGIVVNEKEMKDVKSTTQELAFDCFRAVGKGMPVTPASLLALVLLDEPAGALTWKRIEENSFEVINFCNTFNIPVSESLQGDKVANSLQRALDIMIGNKKVQIVEKEKLNLIYYVIKPEARVEVLYFKNMILHHFLVPCFMNAAWWNMFRGNIKTASGLTKFLISKRKELKYEFYLPDTREMINLALRIISEAIGRKVENLAEAFNFSPQELFKIATMVKRFSTAFTHIYETYYIGCMALKHLANEQFSSDRFLQVSKDIFELERVHGRIVKYSETYTVPHMKSTLEYFLKMEVIDKNLGKYKVIDLKKVDGMIEHFAQELNDQITFNLKVAGSN